MVKSKHSILHEIILKFYSDYICNPTVEDEFTCIMLGDDEEKRAIVLTSMQIFIYVLVIVTMTHLSMVFPQLDYKISFQCYIMFGSCIKIVL